MTIEGKTLFVAWMVGLAHIACGFGVLNSPAALQVTALASLHYISSYLSLSSTVIGWGLLLAGVMAVIGSMTTSNLPRSVHLVLFAPQQFLLLLMVWTITEAILVGRYPDGYIPPDGGWFVQTDQIFALILGTSHSAWLAAYLYVGGVRGGNVSS
jgi:hypothetical protein